jgi:hypothetical protein
VFFGGFCEAASGWLVVPLPGECWYNAKMDECCPRVDKVSGMAGNFFSSVWVLFVVPNSG